MTRLRRFLRLTPPARRTLVRAALLLAASRALLAIAGLDRTRRLLSRASEAREDRARAEELARAMLTAARHVPFGTSCLDRAVALWWLLSKERIRGALRIGVRKAEDDRQKCLSYTAHAWVEHGGAVLLDEEAAGFAAFDAAILPSR